MKSIIKNIILYLIIINIVFLNTGLEVIDASADYEYKISQQSLDEFKNKMLNMPMIGDVTIDFLQESIFYSETIKNVSNEFIKVTNNEDIKSLAEEIIREQDDDVRSMKSILDECKNNIIENKDKEISYVEIYERILNDAFQKISETYNKDLTIEEIYLNTMLVCYEGDLKMETTVLRYINNEKLKEETKNEIEKENKQVMRIKKKLKK
ncbi:DUF305 domain-containing protein [uncultured Clostridium sp.]|uniref:DUF305 domain-containing protein n=1 Tax=uncultured Clostridium sp. TaxID=59620 RepID=UPI0025E72BBA|nr:DUF305 domain-containing protein [uncultured Clostridium sp.]